MSELGSILEYSEDLKDAEAAKSLPASDYPATISSTELATSANSGKTNVKVTWRVKPEDFPADYEDADQYPDGKDIIQYVGTADDKNSRFRMRRFLEAIGVKLGKKIDINDWVGKSAVLTLVPDEFEGVSKENVRGVKSA